MNDIELVASYGFGVYTIPEGFAVADPLDNSDGFYLTGNDLNCLCAETIDSQNLRPSN